MLITKLRIAGFKSFVDPVETPIEPGLTGIVGPNGCGKSNILEAVRWAMGAASAKALRAEDMDAVIFSGSAQRPSREWAEVTLTVQTDADETLEVSRRIRREMGSTYRINGRDARAKDVQLIFADASTGANSPALVRQGQVSELIAAKPENRRRVLEEAAGVAGLQARRHEADLKLSAALANLTRLDEITAEIAAQGEGLRRQARHATRLKTLVQDLRRLEALWHFRRIEAAKATALELQSALTAALGAEADATARETGLARAQDAAQDRLAPLRTEALAADAVLRRAELAQAAHERDVAEAAARLDRLTATLARLKDDAAREEARLADAKGNLARLDDEGAAVQESADNQADDALMARARAASQEAEACEAAWRAATEQVLSAQAAHDAAAAALRAAQTHHVDIARRLTTLEADIAHAQNALPDGSAAARALADAEVRQAETEDAYTHAEAKKLSADTDLAAVREPASIARAALQAAQADAAALDAALAAETPDPLIEAITVVAGYERALAAALGDDVNGAWRTVLGRTPPLWPEGVRPLSEVATAPAPLALRIAWCAVIDDGVDGPALVDGLPSGARLVSTAGDLWRWDGHSRAAGAVGVVALRLERRNRRAALAARLSDLDAAHAKATTVLEVAMKTADAARSRYASANSDRRAAHEALARARVAADAIKRQSHAALTAIDGLRAKAAALSAQAIDAEAAIALARIAADATPSPDATPQQNARAIADSARDAALTLSAAAAQAQRSRALREERLAAIRKERDAWADRARDAAERRGHLHAEIEAAQKEKNAAGAAPSQLAQVREEIDAALTIAQRRQAAAQDAISTGERLAREAASALRSAQLQASAARETRAAAAAHAASAQERADEAIRVCHDALGLTPEQLLSAAGALADSALARGPIADIERRIERMRAERDSAGPVNLRADDELLEVEERLQKLQRERTDVADAVAKLKAGVSRLNSEARARLNTAFETINGHFSTLFHTLFEGGEARLTLTDADDPLACGLEIFASPPGKRLTALSLMSGGEQALTATALIFAVFLANPAPLCVLDEVDAPLDDANVDRYCRMLERMKELTRTRFLVITHNPITMSRMDRLLGVTMPDAGASQIVTVDLAGAKALAA